MEGLGGPAFTDDAPLSNRMQRSVLSTKKVVGLTINGASLNAELLEQLKPCTPCSCSIADFAACGLPLVLCYVRISE